MKLGRTIASALVAGSLAAAPVAAQAATPASRAATEVNGENLRGGFIIPLIALVAIILGILAATSMNNHNDLPHSP